MLRVYNSKVFCNILFFKKIMVLLLKEKFENFSLWSLEQWNREGEFLV